MSLRSAYENELVWVQFKGTLLCGLLVLTSPLWIPIFLIGWAALKIAEEA